MSPKSLKTTHAIPISAYPPVTLVRPLKLFGEAFQVHISTGLTLSPNTVLLAALDNSLLQLMRNQKGRPDRILNDFWRGATGRNKLSKTTKIGVTRLLGPFLPADALAAALEGTTSSESEPYQSDWEALLAGLGEPDESDIYQLVSRLARLDQVAFSAKGMAVTEAMALLETHIGLPHEGWKKYNPNLLLTVALLVDVSLQTLAWLEWRSVALNPSASREDGESRLLSYLTFGKKPLGYWLAKMQKMSGCQNLNAYSNWIRRKGSKRHSYDVSHDLLKKWSSGLIPAVAGKILLKTVGNASDAKRLEDSFYLARFLTFLVDLVVSGTRGEALTWKTAQDQLSRRYLELYELEGKRRASS